MKQLLTSVILVILIILLGKVADLENAEIYLASSFCIAGQYLSKLFMFVFNGGRII